MPESTQSSPSSELYIALPPAGGGHGVVALHAWWGRNEFFKSFCDRLASEGFVVAAPDMFEGEVATTIDGAAALSEKNETLQRDVIEATLIRTVQQLVKNPSVQGTTIGVVGFSFGAFWALWLAQQPRLPISAIVTFYGTGPGDFTSSQAAFLGHFAANDEFEPEANVSELKQSLGAAGKDAEFFTYPNTTHWFFEADRAGAYNAQAADLAWQRTIQFLRTHIHS